jgi:hypothetical protein
MDIREPFSKLKKKIKHRLTGSKHKPGKTGIDAGGEEVDTPGSLPRPEPHFVAGGSHDQEGGEGGTVGGRDFSTNQPPQSSEPEHVPGDESESDQEEGGADIDGKDASQTHSHPHPDVEVVVGSGPGGTPDGA